MAVTVYRSDDASAPQIIPNNGSGSYLALLKACLIDGYGAKSGAGWTLEEDDIATNGLMLIRNNPTTGTGRYFRIQDNGYIDSTAGKAGTQTNFATIRGCESYTDVNNTSGNFPNMAGDSNPDTTGTTTGLCQRYANATNDLAIPWIITADDRTANILIFNNAEGLAITAAEYNDVPHIEVIGDFEPINSVVNPNACLLTGYGFTTASSTSYFRALDTAISTNYRYLNRGYQGNAGAIEFAVKSVLHNYDAYTYAGAPVGTADYEEWGYPNPVAGGMLYSDIYIFEDISAVQNTDSLNSDYNTIQGTYRGLKACGHQIQVTVVANPIGNYLDTVTIDGDDYLLVWSYGGGSSKTVLLQITGDL